ncbi:hypothetical protein AYL99_11993 [Fonsecaea erecta]|uniref:Uncharacterized protein n=1 Tax=Fonsecaea erecta TaxID=1367422 RepID=A0A178Z286_9EURO|nr:hypothetical protein AYL99_11993 [Fonsecaea erecta]OAP53807.1 hypothetical protein AYL99_11993 [Fonsecaea erecta]
MDVAVYFEQICQHRRTQILPTAATRTSSPLADWLANGILLRTIVVLPWCSGNTQRFVPATPGPDSDVYGANGLCAAEYCGHDYTYVNVDDMASSTPNNHSNSSSTSPRPKAFTQRTGKSAAPGGDPGAGPGIACRAPEMSPSPLTKCRGIVAK